MGLVVLPTALVIALAWTAFLVFFASKLVARLRGLRLPKLGKLLVYLGVMILGWVLPSLPGLMEQQRMDKVASQCGWTDKREVGSVEGIFIEGKTLSYLAGELLGTYRVIEYEFNGRLARLAKSETAGPPQPEYIAGRTLRYGLKRVASGFVERAIWRDELAIVDFDTRPQHGTPKRRPGLHPGRAGLGATFSTICSSAIRRLLFGCRKPKLRAPEALGQHVLQDQPEEARAAHGAHRHLAGLAVAIAKADLACRRRGCPSPG
jgi:hypothetical protein